MSTKQDKLIAQEKAEFIGEVASLLKEDGYVVLNQTHKSSSEGLPLSYRVTFQKHSFIFKVIKGDGMAEVEVPNSDGSINVYREQTPEDVAGCIQRGLRRIIA